MRLRDARLWLRLAELAGFTCLAAAAYTVELWAGLLVTGASLLVIGNFWMRGE